MAMLEGAGIALDNSLTTPCDDEPLQGAMQSFACFVGVNCIIS